MLNQQLPEKITQTNFKQSPRALQPHIMGFDIVFSDEKLKLYNILGSTSALLCIHTNKHTYIHTRGATIQCVDILIYCLWCIDSVVYSMIRCGV